MGGEQGDVAEQAFEGAELVGEAEALAAVGAGAGQFGVVDQAGALAGGEVGQGDEAAVGGDVVGGVGGGDGEEVAQHGDDGRFAGLAVGAFRVGTGLGDDGGEAGVAREARADHAGVARAVAGAAGGGGGVAVQEVFLDEAGLPGGEGEHRARIARPGGGGNITGEARLWRGDEVANAPAPPFTHGSGGGKGRTAIVQGWMGWMG